MGWLVGKHFFGHNNIFFYFFIFFFFRFPSGFGLYAVPIFQILQFPEQQLSAGTLPTLQTLRFLGSQPFFDNNFFLFPTLFFGSPWDLNDLRKLQLLLAYSVVPYLPVYVHVLRRQHESALRFQDSRIHFVPWVLFPAYPRLLCCCDWEIPTQYYTQQIILHKNVAL